MPVIKQKAAENLTAAQTLINKALHTASVHCSYYSSYQLVMSYLHNKCGINYNEQTKEAQRKDSHEYIIGKIRDKLTNHSIARDIINDLKYLKNERKLADYHDKIFIAEESCEIKKASERIESKLRQQLGPL